MPWFSRFFNNDDHKDWFAIWATLIVSVTLIAYPTTRFVLDGTRSLYLLVLLFLSFIVLGVRWSRFKELKVEYLDKVLLSFYFLMFVVIFLSAVILGGDGSEMKRVAVHTGFLFSIPIYFLFRLYMPSSRIIWLALVVACYVVAIRAWLEVNGYVEDIAWPSFGMGRANGTMHPIRFGDLTLLMGFISLAGSLYIKDLKIWLRILGGAAFLCGLFASVLSQSRGGWVALPALLVIVLWPLFRGMSYKNKVIVILTIVVGAILVYETPSLKVSERIEMAISDVVKYRDEGDSGTSVGARFDMYETGYSMFQKKPWFGVGVGHYQEQALAYYNEHKGRMSGEVAIWGNPHNEILLHMATRGVVGLVVVLGLFLTGIFFFIGRIRTYDKNIQFYAVSGLMVFVAYLHFGMSISLFIHRDFTLFFVIYATLFAAGVRKESAS